MKRAFSGLNIFKYLRFNRLDDRYGIVFVTALFYSVASAAPPNQIQNQCPLKDPRGQRVWDLIVETTSTNPNPVGVLKNIPSSDTCSNPDLPDIGVFHTPMLKLLNQPSESTQQVSLAQFTWLESMKDFVHSNVFLAQRFPYLFKNKKPTPESIVKNLCGLNPNHCENSGIKNAQAILLESAKALARDLEKSKTKPLTLEDTKNYLNNSLHNLYLFHTPVRALEYKLESKGESQNTEINPVEATSTRNTFDDPRNHPAFKSKNNHDKKFVENLRKLKEETQAQYESIASLIESDPNLMLMRTKTLKRYFKPGIKMPKITGIAEVPVEPSKVSDENEILKAGQEYLDNLQTSVSELHKGLASVKLQKKYGEPETHGRSSALWLSHMIRYNPIAAARAIKQNPSLSPELCKRLQGIEKWEEFEKDLLELSEHAMTASVILSAGITAPEVILSRGLANTVARKFALDEAKVALRYQLAKSLNAKLGHAVFTATIGQHVGSEFKLLEELDQTKRALLLYRGVSRDDLTSTKQQLNQNHEALIWDAAFLAVPKVFRHTPAGKIFKNIPTAQKVADLIKWKHLQPRRIQALFEEFTLACGYFDARCGVAMSAFHAASAKERLQKLKDFENSRYAKNQNNQPTVELEITGYDQEGIPVYGTPKRSPAQSHPTPQGLQETKQMWLAGIQKNPTKRAAFSKFLSYEEIKKLSDKQKQGLIEKLYQIHLKPNGIATNRAMVELSEKTLRHYGVSKPAARKLMRELGDVYVLGSKPKTWNDFGDFTPAHFLTDHLKKWRLPNDEPHPLWKKYHEDFKRLVTDPLQRFNTDESLAKASYEDVAKISDRIVSDIKKFIAPEDLIFRPENTSHPDVDFVEYLCTTITTELESTFSGKRLLFKILNDPIISERLDEILKRHPHNQKYKDLLLHLEEAGGLSSSKLTKERLPSVDFREIEKRWDNSPFYLKKAQVTSIELLAHYTPTLRSAESILRTGILKSGGYGKEGPDVNIFRDPRLHGFTTRGRGGYFFDGGIFWSSFYKSSFAIGGRIRLSYKVDPRTIELDLNKLTEEDLSDLKSELESYTKSPFRNMDLNEYLFERYGVGLIIPRESSEKTPTIILMQQNALLNNMRVKPSNFVNDYAAHPIYTISSRIIENHRAGKEVSKNDSNLFFEEFLGVASLIGKESLNKDVIEALNIVLGPDQDLSQHIEELGKFNDEALFNIFNSTGGQYLLHNIERSRRYAEYHKRFTDPKDSRYAHTGWLILDFLKFPDKKETLDERYNLRRKLYN